MATLVTRRFWSSTSSRRRLGGVLLTLVAGLSPVKADAVRTWAVLPIRILDTSGEPRDQTAEHAARLIQMADALGEQLGTDTGRRVITVTPDVLAAACPEPSTPCILAMARERGASLAFVGVVHKSSTLIMQMFARIVDANSGATVFTSDLNFRGDTDESWQRMTDFLAREIVDDPALRK